MNNKFRLSNVILAALVIAVVALSMKVSTLSSQLNSLENNLENNLNNAVNRLQNDMDSIYANVDEQMKAEASLLTRVDTVYGELDPKTHRLAMELTVTPKRLTDDMALSVQIGGEVTPLTRSGNTFRAVVPVSLFNDYDSYPLLSIRTAEGIQTQELTDVDVACLYGAWLPTLSASYSGSSSFTDAGGLSLNGLLSVDAYLNSKNSPVSFGELTLIAEVGGKEIQRESLGRPMTDIEGHCSLPLVSFYPVAKGDVLYLSLLGEDSLGYVHKVPVLQWYESPDDDVPVEEFSTYGEQIFDKNGVLLSEG